MTVDPDEIYSEKEQTLFEGLGFHWNETTGRWIRQSKLIKMTIHWSLDFEHSAYYNLVIQSRNTLTKKWVLNDRSVYREDEFEEVLTRHINHIFGGNG